MKKLDHIVELYAQGSSLVQAPPKPKADPLVALHAQHTADVVRGIKNDGGRISSSQDAYSIPGGDGLETLILHGWTATPNRKTFIRTYRYGTKTVQMQLLDQRVPTERQK